MRNLKTLPLLLTALLLASAFAVAQTPNPADAAPKAEKQSPPPPGPAKPVKLPAVTEKKLANGLTVVMAPLPNVPKITARMAIMAGQAADSDQHPGIAQLTAATVNEGTTTRTSKQIKEELRSIGGSLNVFTDADATTILTTSLSEFTPRMFALMSDVAMNASFPEKEVALAKDNLIQNIRVQRSNPGFLANERFQKAIFGDHPYGFVVPDEKSVQALTRAELAAFAKKYYLPNNAYLIVVGDFQPDALLAEVEKAFGGWKSGEVPKLQVPEPPKRDRRQIYFVDRPGSIQANIYLGVTAPPRKAPDYFSLRTANTIYGGSFYSRLTKNIRETKGYTYSPFSTAFLMRQAGFFQVGAAVRNDVAGLTLNEMLYELNRMRVAPVEEEELKNAKTYSIGSYVDSLASQAGLADRISSIYTYDLPRTHITDFIPELEKLTLQDIHSSSAKYFDTYRAAVVVVGDYAKIKDQIAPFGDITLYDAEGNVVTAEK